jgi:retron-type reverse transcriptase
MAQAGVLEDGVVNVSERGTGQGAVISPLLANIYLHYMLDHLLIATTMASAILQD